MKSNIHKKATFEDKFDRKYACWVVNHPKAWHRDKVRNRRQFRRRANDVNKFERLSGDSIESGEV